MKTPPTMSTPPKTIAWADGKVRFLDQTRLPVESVVLEIDDYRDMIEAIRSLRIRGAPALGVAAAYGIVLGAREAAREAGANGAGFTERIRSVAREIAASRPTAVNVAWAAARMERDARGARRARRPPSRRSSRRPMPSLRKTSRPAGPWARTARS